MDWITLILAVVGIGLQITVIVILVRRWREDKAKASLDPVIQDPSLLWELKTDDGREDVRSVLSGVFNPSSSNIQVVDAWAEFWTERGDNPHIPLSASSEFIRPGTFCSLAHLSEAQELTVRGQVMRAHNQIPDDVWEILHTRAWRVRIRLADGREFAGETWVWSPEFEDNPYAEDDS